ncbi:unnamed protein product [Boreogadus saida]
MGRRFKWMWVLPRARVCVSACSDFHHVYCERRRSERYLETRERKKESTIFGACSRVGPSGEIHCGLPFSDGTGERKKLLLKYPPLAIQSPYMRTLVHQPCCEGSADCIRVPEERTAASKVLLYFSLHRQGDAARLKCRTQAKCYQSI